MAKDSILIICAHSDDQIFGVGGTIAKYAKEGKKVKTIILSYGEMSHPWLQKNITREMRRKESEAANKVIGGSEVIFYDLREGHFAEDAKTKGTKAKLKKVIETLKPSKVFTHSVDDPLPDHKAVNKIVLDLFKGLKCECSVYTFEVWTPIVIKDRKKPRMYVNITNTFGTKLRALRCFKSQWMAMFSLLWSVYVRAIWNGLNSRSLFAERFTKIR